MGNFNRWGCTEAMVLRKYQMGTYTPEADDFGGTDEIATEMDQAAAALENVMPSMIFRKLTDPDLEQVVSRATLHQTTFTLGLKPIVAGLLSVWVGAPTSFSDRPVKRYDMNTSGSMVEIQATDFTVTEATGVVVLQGTYAAGLNAGDVAYASYRMDTMNEDFAVPSIADLVAIGAAGALGAKVYPRQDATWQHVETLQQRFSAAIDAMAAGQWSPTELRLLRWWEESSAEPTQGDLFGSVRKYRS